ncbi:MAG: hypothetical protein P1U56_17105 [Saprospiraceae bacterium]|nr:hypothetical protein [Saprospiraceae bacterium]
MSNTANNLTPMDKLQRFGNYTFISDVNNSKLNYVRSTKVWIDSFLSLLFAIVCILFIGILIYRMTEEGVSLISVILLLLSGYVAFIKIAYAIDRIGVTEGIIDIDRKSDLLTIRSSRFRKVTLPLKDINGITYHLHSDMVGFEKRKQRFCTKVQFTTTTNQSIQALLINSESVLDKGMRNTKQELMKITHTLVKHIASELNIPFEKK